MRATQIIGVLALLVLQNTVAIGQQPKLSGKVIGVNTDGVKEPLIGANLHWAGTSIGTATDANGEFSIFFEKGRERLVVSYIGFETDTLSIEKAGTVLIEMFPEALETVEVVHEQRSTSVSYLNPLKVEQMNRDELAKAACCNLSESFETSPTVDVSFTDAITGTRQIQMLGLAGPYTMLTRENMPDTRGLAAVYGISYTPGTWIESIQVIKGAGSVINGFESIAGQINVELEKPEKMDKFYLNLYGSEMGRIEANANATFKINDNVSTAVLFHTSFLTREADRNDDGFLDMTPGQDFIGLNRWKAFLTNGWRVQAGVKVTIKDRYGGQLDYDEDEDFGTTNAWGLSLENRRFEGWAKFGWVNPDKAWQSIGIQVSGVHHNQDAYFGLRPFNGEQTSGYFNAIYQTILGDTRHTVRAGLSFQYDAIDEEIGENNYDRDESVPGAFAEYTYGLNEGFTLVAGMRADHHNQFGWFATPRLHLRYAPDDYWVFRASAGKGARSANIFAENYGLLASSRELVIEADGNKNTPYGLDQEIAWNFGVNVSRNFKIGYREGFFSLDYYYTDFKNQIVVDVDRSSTQAFFYNLDGDSYAHSFQAQVDYEITPRLDVRLAYRWQDVQTTYSGVRRFKPLVSEHRAFINLAYETRSNWKLDGTLNWQGTKRLPLTSDSPVEFQLDERSPDFLLFNAQITKAWAEKYEVYLGAENLFNFRQDDPIVSADDPFNDYFDSSMVWGPIFGRNVYLGFRYRIL